MHSFEQTAPGTLSTSTCRSAGGDRPGLAAVLVGCLALGVANHAAAEELRSLSSTTSVTSRVATSVKTVDEALRDDCFKIDKYTGQKVPCTSSGSGGTVTSEDPPAPSADKPKAFAYFNADHTEDDFHADNESVLPVAYLMAQLSAAAYRDPGNDGTPGEEQAYYLFEEWGLQYEPVLEAQYSSFLDLGGVGGESKAYVVYNEHAVIVAFEGSKGALDWEESNIDFWPYAKPEWGNDNYLVCVLVCYEVQRNVVTLHNGFYDAMAIIFADVFKTIEPLLAGRRLWITGHSLGGAVAQLTAFRLTHEHGIDVQGVHVFGAPAVGDGNWANVFEMTMSNVHRWNVEGDPAPVATQAPMFYHVGIVDNLHTNGDLTLDDTMMFGYAPQCWPGYGALVTHMSYWPRMHEELEQYYPHLIDLFPKPLPGSSLPCN